MSGLLLLEDKLEMGSIQRRIGQGMTAEILRNLCLTVFQEKNNKWKYLVDVLYKSFRIHLNDPEYNPVDGLITITYEEEGKRILDLTSAGRGFQQILLLLAFVYANHNSVLLIDEPDAHLEVIRQFEVFNLLRNVVKDEQSQLIIATHSEKVLSEAAGQNKVIGFLGKPHIVNKEQQLVKALTTIGFDQYMIAEQKKCVLYLEGSTDLLMLKAFANVLDPSNQHLLNDLNVKYVGNIPSDARNHFHALVEAVPDLKGLAIFDHLNKTLHGESNLMEMMWKRNEIENYLPLPQVIERYIHNQKSNLFEQHNWNIMREIIEDLVPRRALNDPANDWWIKTKITDDFLDVIFREYFQRLKMPVTLMQKGKYHELALLAKPEELDPEIKEKLDAVWKMIQEVKKLNE